MSKVMERLGCKMSNEEKKRANTFPSPVLPGRLERPEERRWPSPVPLPAVPSEDVGRLLNQILKRLDTIEQRLDRIEKLLMGKQPTS